MTIKERRSAANVKITIHAPAAATVVVSPIWSETQETPDRGAFFGLGDISKKAKRELGNLYGAAKAVVDNTVDDIQGTIGDVSECLSRIDAIRVRVMDRGLEYTSDVTRYVVSAVLDAILAAEGRLDPISEDPQLTLWWLQNPKRMMWPEPGQEPEDPAVFPADNPGGLTPVELEHIRSSHRPFVFVHGAGYGPGWQNAIEFFKSMERELQLFKNEAADDLAVIIVSWNSELTNPLRQSILEALTVVDPAAPEVMWVVWAIYWRALEKRAGVAASQMGQFVDKLTNTPGPQMFAFSHSLGNYVWAEAIWNSDANLPEIGRWWCIEAAIPYGSFDREGRYASVVSRYSAHVRTGRTGLRVWYSNTDAVLGTIYVYATQAVAVGQWGVFGTEFPVNTEDVTADAGISHDDTRLGILFGDTRGYFTGVGERFRQAMIGDFAPIGPGDLSLAIFPATLSQGSVGRRFVQAISVSGPHPPYTVQVTQGTLTPGLTLTNGSLSGTPTQEGSFAFTISAFDRHGAYVVYRDYVHSVAAFPTTIVPSSLPAGAVGQPYAQTFLVSGPSPHYTVRVTLGALPPGLALSEEGALAGTPSGAGSFAFTVSAFDADRTYVAFHDYVLSVASGSVPSRDDFES